MWPWFYLVLDVGPRVLDVFELYDLVAVVDVIGAGVVVVVIGRRRGEDERADDAQKLHWNAHSTTGREAGKQALLARVLAIFHIPYECA